MEEFFEWKRYNIKKDPIGRGSYSKVYYGFEKNSKKEIALKKIFFSKLSDIVKDKIVSEISILQKLDHPNIIKLYEYKFDGDYIFLITEYCKDGDLTKYIKNRENNKDVYNIIQQIVKGMNYLNSNNIIHRDIKPENILLHNNIVKIVDFGFSYTIKDNLEFLNTMCGTPLYMSPEILFLNPYDISSEIWSIGILFYFLVFKKHPFGYLENIEDYRSKIKSSISIFYDFKDIENIENIENIVDVIKKC